MSWRRVALAGSALCAAVALGACGTSSQAALPAPSTSTSEAPSGLVPRGETMAGLRVTKVVDGDTIHVDVAGADVTVRLIAIDTPETVKPGSPVACFGPEASQFAQDRLADQQVTLEFDAAQDREDRYGRTLAYVWIEGAGGMSLFNLEAVEGGYAEELQYGPRPGAWQAELRAAEERAVAAGLGRWGTCPDEPAS
ncbi:MAG: thermonuclease family protein [Actinomycetota bacterium]|nr:thermonuclease family protein [Actinomycetota bacterium]